MAIAAGAIEDLAVSRALSVSVVIPTKNEARNIAWVLERIPEDLHQVLIVDAGSSDGTIDVARATRSDVDVIIEPRPGKGIALRTGFAAATGDVVVMLDADGSMDPAEIDRFVDRVKEGHDVVKGSRFADGGGSTDLTWFRSLGNRMLLRLVNLLYGATFTELCYGFFAFRRHALRRLDLEADGFEIETEIVVKSLRADLRVAEVPSMEATRLHGRSNLRPIRDGIRVLKMLITARWHRPAVIIDLREEAPWHR